MKTVWALTLSFILIFALAACQKEEAPAVVAWEEAERSLSEAQSTSEAGLGEMTFTETVLTDTPLCRFSIIGVEQASDGSFVLQAVLENRSAKRSYLFSVTNAAVNGVQADPFFAKEVAAGTSCEA